LFFLCASICFAGSGRLFTLHEKEPSERPTVRPRLQPHPDDVSICPAHPRNENAPSDLSGFYEWSPNLADWYHGDGVDGPPGGLTVGIVPGHNGSTTTVTATVSGTTGRLFLRAGVMRN
jgi:hypothetical protein